MKKNEPIKSIMTADPFHVERGEAISKVRRALASQQIHHVPVTESGKLVGIISSTDMMRLTLEAWGHDAEAVDAMLDRLFTVDQVMNHTPEHLFADDTVRDAAKLLADGSFHSAPIVDGDGALVGIVTSTDLIKYLLEQY